MLALIDGDIPAFTECAAAENRGNAFGSYFPDVVAIADSASAVIKQWTAQAEATECKLIMSHPDRRNFRKHLNPTQYKVARTKGKPAGYNDVVDILKARFDNFSISGVEGDDTCLILHTSETMGDTVTVSTDKDFKTAQGWIFNPMKQVMPEMITPNEATHFLMQQTLEGDSADGYKGAMGIGKVKALRAIEDVDNSMDPARYSDLLWSRVMDVYNSVYGESKALDLAVLQYRMAHILHRDDYDPVTNTIQLWHPTSPETFELDSF